MISVVMATYNGEKCIKRQLDSLRDQTRPADEVLIFDDCSTDGTFDLVDSYIRQNELYNWKISVNTKNLGWKANFAEGLKKVSGDIVFLCDQDDVWDADKIEVMSKVLDEHSEIGVLACNYEPVYESENAQKILTPYGKYGRNHIQSVTLSGKTFRPIRPGCGFAFRKDIIAEVTKLWFPGCTHDSMIWGIALLRRNLYILNEVHHRFYRNGENNTPLIQRKSSKERIENLEIRKQLAEKYLSDMEEIPAKERKWLEKYARFVDKRVRFMQSGNLLVYLSLLGQIQLYPKPASWVGDFYAYIHSR